MSSIIIRSMNQNDIPQITEIYNHQVLTSTATFDLEIKSAEEMVQWFTSLKDKYPVLVAEVNDQVVGYCALAPFNAKKAYDKTATLIIYLGRNWMGRGIGTRLMEHMLDKAREHQFHSVISLITGDNTESIALHTKFGFQLSGKLREAGYKFDRWLDVEYYQLILSDW